MSNKTLDDLLDKVLKNTVDFYDEDSSSAYLKRREDLKAQIAEAIEQIIGEDFPKPPLGDFWNVGRNQLRNEQREALKVFLGDAQ